MCTTERLLVRVVDGDDGKGEWAVGEAKDGENAEEYRI